MHSLHTLFKPLEGAPVRSSETPDQVVWNACMVNCGSRCALRVHVTDGRITRINTDNSGSDTYGRHQIRACLRGRSMRKRIYAPERITYPMKRTGPRGTGQFTRISWDEALDTVAEAINRIKETYGNEAFYLHYGTGSIGSIMSKSWPPDKTPIARLMNCVGGYLNHYNTYSSAQIKTSLSYLYGEDWPGGNALSDIANSRLAVFFCNNPAETHMSGGGMVHDLLTAKNKNQVKIVVVDPRYTDTAVVVADQWIPIRPGTDGALAGALAYVLIKEDLADASFLGRYALGYDETSLPDGIPAGNSYRSYILGTGPDQTPKTPGWAAEITGVPVDIIVQLGREIGTAKPAYITQGLGVQRHANGEQASRAICMLAVLTGNVGIRGGNHGAGPMGAEMPFASFPTLNNPVKTAIPVFLWTDAVLRGSEMTALGDGVRGASTLKAPIKFIWNFAGNALVNQHADIHRTREILADQSLCEMIVVIEQVMTSSAAYADILLPAVTSLEENDIALESGASSDMAYVIFCRQAINPVGECRSVYDMCAGIAARLGIEKRFTEDRTRDQWLEYLLSESRQQLPDLPTSLEEAWQVGIYRKTVDSGPRIALKRFREDATAYPLKTPSGKIEIFSERLWRIGQQWELPEGDQISALPEFLPEREGHSDLNKAQFPLQMITHHYKQRTHSTYGNVDWLEEAAPQQLWINPLDAERRGIEHGDTVLVYNSRGRCLVPAKVTPRIMPGVVTLPQGAWFRVDTDGIDRGACANTLTSLHPSPLAKGNPHHSNLVEVKRYESQTA